MLLFGASTSERRSTFQTKSLLTKNESHNYTLQYIFLFFFFGTAIMLFKYIYIFLKFSVFRNKAETSFYFGSTCRNIRIVPKSTFVSRRKYRALSFIFFSEESSFFSDKLVLSIQFTKLVFGSSVYV